MEQKKWSDYIIDFSTIPYERKLEERALYPFSTLNFLTGGMELGEISIIAGETGCVDKDTEFFNGKGWKPISKYEKGDKVLQYNPDGTAELVMPIRYIKEPCAMFYRFRTKYGISQLLSEDHRVVYINGYGDNKLREIRAVDFYEKCNNAMFKGKFITSFFYNGNGIDMTDDEIRVMVAVVADGAFRKGNSLWCRMNLKKECKKTRIRQLLSNAKIEYREKHWNPKDEEYTNFIFYAPKRFKVFPKEWYSATQHQLQIIADELKYWDAHVNHSRVNKFEQIQVFSTIKENADFCQFVYAATNKRASIGKDDRVGSKHITSGKKYTMRSICYNVIVSHNNVTGFGRKTKIHRVESADGYKYCFQVPSSYLVLRRNNCIFITGNCGKTTLASMCVNEIIKHDKCFCIFGESTLEKQAHAQYRQMAPIDDRDFKFVSYMQDGKKTNVGKFFVTPTAEQKIKEMTAKRLFYYDPRGGMDIDSILAVMQVAHEKGGIKYFVVDNIMQIDTKTSDEIREMKDSFEQLRRFVIDNKVHCMVLAHYRKSNDYGQFRRRLEEIAGTSAIGNKCATALNIIRLDNVDRESKYSKAFAQLLERNGYDFAQCDAVIEVLKTRHNKLGFVGLKYNKKTNTYYESGKINNNQEENEKAEVVALSADEQAEIDIDNIFGDV